MSVTRHFLDKNVPWEVIDFQYKTSSCVIMQEFQHNIAAIIFARQILRRERILKELELHIDDACAFYHFISSIKTATFLYIVYYR